MFIEKELDFLKFSLIKKTQELYETTQNCAKMVRVMNDALTIPSFLIPHASPKNIGLINEIMNGCGRGRLHDVNKSYKAGDKAYTVGGIYKTHTAEQDVPAGTDITNTLFWRIYSPPRVLLRGVFVFVDSDLTNTTQGIRMSASTMTTPMPCSLSLHGLYNANQADSVNINQSAMAIDSADKVFIDSVFAQLTLQKEQDKALKDSLLKEIRLATSINELNLIENKIKTKENHDSTDGFNWSMRLDSTYRVVINTTGRQTIF
jgi:hypothetical protein